MAKFDNLGYNIEEDFKNDFDENLDEDFCSPLDEGTNDSEKDPIEAPQKQHAGTSKLVAQSFLGVKVRLVNIFYFMGKLYFVCNNKC
jgi:hypothetical protein